MIRIVVLFMLWVAGGLAGAAEFLPPSEAFRPSAQAIDGRTIEVRFDIAKGYYLYRDKFRFAIDAEAAKAGSAVLPKGEAKEDENFGKVEVYYQEVQIRLPVERSSSGGQSVMLQITSQGCAETGICYPPQKHLIGVDLPDPAAVPAASAGTGADESGRIARLLDGASLWFVAVTFLGFGLLLALTPCVFPMFPILSGIIVGAGGNSRGVSHARGFVLALAYVLGMATTYAVVGVAAGFSGMLLSTALQNVWVLGGFSFLFVALALSMFGFYDLQMPAFLQSKVSEEAAHLKGGSLPGVAFMGALSALIVGPCVAAPLAGALLYIGRTGDAVLGGLALFCLAVGMGVPLLVIGLSAGTLLPKGGAWMEAVRKAFGVILLATALWIVSPVVPVAVQMIGWALLLIMPAIYMHAIDPLPPHANDWHRFWKGVGVAMLCAGLAMLVGVLSGGRDPWQPLSVLRGVAAVEQRPLPFERVRSIAELDARIAAPGKPVMLDFYADWCVSCKEMERFTFSDPRVQSKLSGWRLLQADVTANSEDDKALLARFQLFGPPGLIFFDGNGQELRSARVVGYQSPEAFLQTLSLINP